MGITIVAVGKIKKDFANAGAREYRERIQRFGRLEVMVVQEEKIPPGRKLTAGMKRQVLLREADRIRSRMTDSGRWFGLDREGRMLDSDGFANLMGITMRPGPMGFVIGGALGLDPDLKSKDLELISFSKMTFPHDLFQVMLLEQIYRGWTILERHPYHK